MPTSPVPAEAERARLVRLCARLTGNPDAAEDLAQEALLRGHLHAGRLQAPDRRAAWLAAIARHVCLDWIRQRRRAAAHAAELGSGDWDAPAPLDLDAELERTEIVHLLDRSLALLPVATRTLLIDRYVRDLAVAEIGVRRGLTEGAVAMRLQRGREELRRLLLTRFREDAAAYGLVPAVDEPEWQHTRLWCQGCGERRLRGRYRPDWGIHLECPDCNRGSAVLLYIQGTDPVHGTPIAELFQGARGFRRAVTRVGAAWHTLLHAGLGTAEARCRGCGRPAPLRVGGPYGDVETVCRRCRAFGVIGVYGVAESRPELRAFVRAHPRIRGLRRREVETAGTRAVVLGFQSVTSADRLEFVYTRDSMVLLHVHGSTGTDGEIGVIPTLPPAT